MYDKKNVQEAIKWFKIIAEKGDRHAQYKLGLLLLEEKEIKKAEAIKWFEKVAEQGHGMAQYELKQLKNK